jgi:multidrug efflux system membrane fusion protein
MIFSCALVTAMLGCQRPPEQPAPQAGTSIPVSQPVQRQITDYVDFTGRTDAINAVGIKARVTGYLTEVAFTEGREVKKGDLLMQVDPRPYQAQLTQAQSQVTLNQASLRLAETTLRRDQLLQRQAAVSQEQIDQDIAARDEAAAGLKVSQAAVDVYKLNLDFTRVTSPIAGQAGRAFLTVGNLVNQDQTLLTTVVSLDPIYAYFDMDEPTLLRIKRAINEGRIPLPKKSFDVPIFLGLQGETDFPHQGTFNFINNIVNPSTGTIAVRGVFANPRPEGGTRLLAPGMFVCICLPIGQPHSALLVIDRAIGSDQGLKFVYVLDAQNRVQYRRVTTGPLEDDGLRVIEGNDLHPDDWVIAGGLQQVRPRMEVTPDRIPMPSITGGQGAGQGATGRPQPPPPGENSPNREQPGRNEH